MYEKGFDGLDDEDIQAATQLGEQAFQIVAGRLLKNVGGANLGATITKNKELGNKLRDKVAAVFKRIGFDVALEVYKPTPYGPRFIDVEIRYRGKAMGFEVKLGGSPYTGDQKKKDDWLWRNQGYRVILIRGGT